VGPNIHLKEYDIKKIMKWGVAEVETTADVIQQGNFVTSGSAKSNQILHDYEQLLSLRKRLVEVHSNACYKIDRMYSLIRKDLPIELPAVQKVVSDILGLIKENSNVFLFLGGLDDVDRNYLVTHSVNVTFYALIIGQAMNYSDKQLIELGTGTILIDSGMTKIPVYIIHKQSNLTTANTR
jgi:HD-GYP domain-containing protein (c-di-GMP phosphodiesterase class II)